MKGEKVKVLVVDDAPANRMVLTALLKRAGHVVSVAATVDEARKVFAAEGPDAILTDLHLGADEDGVSLARSLRQLARGRRVRMALMTADVSAPADSDGAIDAVLEKPVSFEVLKSFLGEVEK